MAPARLVTPGARLSRGPRGEALPEGEGLRRGAVDAQVVEPGDGVERRRHACRPGSTTGPPSRRSSSRTTRAAGPGSGGGRCGRRRRVRASRSVHTDRLIRMLSSSKTRTAVASPSSVWRRQTKPGLASARALIGSRAAMNSATCGSSTGATSRPTLTCARWCSMDSKLGRGMSASSDDFIHRRDRMAVQPSGRTRGTPDCVLRNPG